eukprot:172772-Rhodomonas_salina.2
MRTVRVLFLKSTSSDHWINRLVSTLDPPFCHVEIEFEMDGGSENFETIAPDNSVLDSQFFQFALPHTVTSTHAIASSIYHGETVFMKRRTFANPNYTILTLTVADTQFKRMFAYCKHACEQTHSFDAVGMYLSYIPLGCRRPHAKKTFCSSYVASVLIEGGVKEMQHVNPAYMRPSTIYKLLSKNQQQCFSSVPYKINLIQSKPVTVCTVNSL